MSSSRGTLQWSHSDISDDDDDDDTISDQTCPAVEAPCNGVTVTLVMMMMMMMMMLSVTKHVQQ